jgi:hypothetical protein
VGGGALAFYLYERKKSSSEGVSPEEEEKLLGALSKAGGGGGEGSIGTAGSTTAAPAAEGPKGEAGPVGATGDAGPQGEAPAAGLEKAVESLASNQLALEQRLNKPPGTSHTSAAQALPKGEFKNAKTGAVERTFTKGNGIFHEYVTGKKKGTVFKVGTVHKAAAKPPKKKPAPVHKKITVHKAAPKPAAKKEKKKEPVHR